MYKVTISGSIRSNLNGKHCALILSLDEICHEGEMLFAILKKTTALFNCISIVLVDSLHRHDLGSQWLRRNFATLQKCHISPDRILRWSEWLNHAEYKAALLEIENFYRRSPIFKNLVDQTCNQQLNKIMIFEECALLLLWKKANFHYIAYPHELNPAMECVLEKIQTVPNILLPLIYQVKLACGI